MAAHPLLPDALDVELDEVLSLVPVVDAVPELADRVFGRLTDCLVEAVIHDVRARHARGELARADYLTEVCQVVVALQDRRLLGRGRVDPSTPG